MIHNECWSCGSAAIYYRDVLDMYWCEPCWNTADDWAAAQHEAAT